MKVENDKIRNRDEETECDYCGEPLYVGDKAVFIDYIGTTFCSHKCCDDWRYKHDHLYPEFNPTFGKLGENES